MNDRRKLLGAGLCAGMLGWPLSSLAQLAQRAPGKLHRLGIFQPGAPPDPLLDALREGLRDLGYVEGRDIVFEIRWAEGRRDQLDLLAAELVAAKVDVISTLSTPLAIAARRATATVPIVFTGVGDPVGTGVVSNLAHPGGNATGLATMAPELSAKRLELLHELVPEMSRMAMLWNDTNPSMMLGAHQSQEAGIRLGLVIQSQGVHDLVDFDASFAAIRNGPSTAMLTLADPFTRANRQRIVDFAARSRLPAIYDTREFVESGGLISYGPNLAALQRKAALYIDKVFRGANPGDLPVEQPTGFELVVNMKTARALGISIPASILARADQVIE
jgi:putative ABC transport system substrate-binding protein